MRFLMVEHLDQMTLSSEAQKQIMLYERDRQDQETEVGRGEATNEHGAKCRVAQQETADGGETGVSHHFTRLVQEKEGSPGHAEGIKALRGSPKRECTAL